VGAIGMASVFLYGVGSTTTSPNELVATQKASEAVESVFGARDAHTIAWAQLTNVSQGGIFLDGPRDMKVAGADGILNTSDDGAIESVVLPGPDQDLTTTGDNITQTLARFQREITFENVPGRTDLRKVTVTITYPAGTVTRTYTLTVLISAFA
jgi:hypothetical protein